MLCDDLEGLVGEKKVIVYTTWIEVNSNAGPEMVHNQVLCLDLAEQSFSGQLCALE